MLKQPHELVPLVILLGAGLALRLALAYLILPASGFAGDVGLYAYWARTLANVGPYDFYATAEFADYPPGYLYILWFIGELGQGIASIANADAKLVIASMIKIPPMLLDVCAAFMLYRIARDWSADRANAERIALTAAAIYLFCPVTWYDSAIWGQTDAVGACIMLAGVIALMHWPSEVAASVAVLAALIKPQFGVMLAPIIGIVLLRRHLLSPGDVPADASAKRAYSLRRDGPVRLLTCALTGIVVFYALAVPFHLDLRTFLERMTATAQFYPYLSVNAYNPWALVGSGATPALAFGTPGLEFGTMDTWSRDDIPLVGSLTGVTIGTALLGLGFLIGGARLLRRADSWSVVLVGAYLSICFFVLPTRVHERYLFAVFAFAPLLTAFDKKWLWATVALSVGSFINLHGILTVASNGTPNVIHLPLGEFCRSPAGVLISIVLHTSAFFFAISQLHPSAAPSGAANLDFPRYSEHRVTL